MFFGIYLIIGAFSGFLAGLLGLGGGVVVVPTLAAVFAGFNVMPSAYVMQMAVGTSLSTIVITFIASLYAHVKRDSVRWDIVRLILPGVLCGVLIGTSIAGYLPSSYLKFFFALFLLFIAYRLFRGELAPAAGNMPSRWKMASFACGVGILSGVLGVGGGLILVPFLIRGGLNMRQATGTSVACGMFIGITASLSFMFIGQAHLDLPWSTGFIYWPAFLGVAIASVIFAPIGTVLAYKLSPTVLKRVLAIFLVLVAIDMLIPTKLW
jgi:uncharacterized membrane protein YfcA